LRFARLRPSDWVVFVAALALLFTTAFDWYSTQAGVEARKIQENARPQEGQPSGQAEAEVERVAGALAESNERNAWQEDGTIDRVVLIALLVTAGLGVLAAFWRASGREARALGPYGWAGLAACITALLVLYRILQEPGFDELTTVQIGAPLALGVLGVFAFAAATSLRQEGRPVAEQPAAA
jgi:peptidoglycan/LPS O-acetylase OafA/YrhL